VAIESAERALAIDCYSDVDRAQIGASRVVSRRTRLAVVVSCHARVATLTVQ